MATDGDGRTRGADQDNKSCSFLLIEGNSTLNVAGLETFGKKVKLAECGIPYATISIMGPQSSGKSTLLNHLFRTNFREMDALNARGQTTQGIWLAKYPDVKRCTLVMDLEGSDGRERGEDDTKFEKQAALFAFAVSDIVLINMWSHDVGRVQAASTPLLRTVFEAMRKLKLRDSKTTLWFVLRDKPKSPMKVLEELLWKDITQIWDSVAKGTPLSETFKVTITGLSSYEYKEERFVEEVANLKHQLLEDLAGDWRDKRPSSGFSFSVKDLWQRIKENKDLDVPAHKIMVATVRCEEIVNTTFGSLVKNEAWRQLQSDVLSALVKDFGKRLSVILDKHLLGYDKETMYFDEGVRTEKRRQLMDKMLQLVEPAHQTMLEHIHSRTLNDFKYEFPKEFGGRQVFLAAISDCKRRFMTQFHEHCRDAAINQVIWDSSKLHAKLQSDIDAHVGAIYYHAMSEYLKRDKERLEELLSGSLEKLFVKAGDDTWQEIRKLFRLGIQSSFSTFSTDIDQQTKDKNLKELVDYARQVIKVKSREEAVKVQTRMEKRFERFFSHDDSNNLRVWTGKEDIQAIRETALTASLKLLSIMAAIRLDDDADDIQQTLFSAFIDNNESAKDSLDSCIWEKVPLEKTLIEPVKCKYYWENFNESSELIVNKAQENRKAAGGYDMSVIAAGGIAIGSVVAGVGAVAGTAVAVTVGAPAAVITAGIAGVVGAVGLAGTAIESMLHKSKSTKR